MLALVKQILGPTTPWIKEEIDSFLLLIHYSRRPLPMVSVFSIYFSIVSEVGK